MRPFDHCFVRIRTACGCGAGFCARSSREPQRNGRQTEEVGGPRCTGEDTLPKIPSEYKKDKQDLAHAANFKTDVDLVTLDVSVVDNKGQFIPGIPAGNFRLLEDNVPQQITKVDMGQTPMTIAMVIEFSQKFQSMYSWAWFQIWRCAGASPVHCNRMIMRQ